LFFVLWEEGERDSGNSPATGRDYLRVPVWPCTGFSGSFLYHRAGLEEGGAGGNKKGNTGRTYLNGERHFGGWRPQGSFNASVGPPGGRTKVGTTFISGEYFFQRDRKKGKRKKGETNRPSFFTGAKGQVVDRGAGGSGDRARFFGQPCFFSFPNSIFGSICVVVRGWEGFWRRQKKQKKWLTRSNFYFGARRGEPLGLDWGRVRLWGGKGGRTHAEQSHSARKKALFISVHFLGGAANRLLWAGLPGKGSVVQ